MSDLLRQIPAGEAQREAAHTIQIAPLAEIQRQLRNEFLGTDQVLERFLDNARCSGSQVFLRAFLIVKRGGARQINERNCVEEFSGYMRAKIKA
ncbi:MAG TPA: hypothetical protein VKD70_18550 [Candidatus Acidoferrum sp.]|nr:hypothetical protein [Candidatus Acidoferrum sp.]